MQILSPSSSRNWMLPLKVVLISTSVLSMALMLKLSVPVISNLAVPKFPNLWNVVVLCLKPPYLYVLVNCIIVTIVASSMLQSKVDDNLPPPGTPVQLQATYVRSEYTVADGGAVWKKEAVELMRPEFFEYGTSTTVYDEWKAGKFSGVDQYRDIKPVASEEKKTANTVNSKSSLTAMDREAAVEYSVLTTKLPASARFSHQKEVKDNPDGTCFVDEHGDVEPAVSDKAKTGINMNSKSSWTSRNKNAVADYSIPNLPTQKPLASARFSHRKGVKANPEVGRTLRVSKSKRDETLESTWRTITEGRSMPLTRHLRKSDTWETHGRQQPTQEDTTQHKMNKSETFNDRTTVTTNNSTLGSSTKLKRDPSLSQDELNRRVEAFIQKFNEDMRIQRQESLNQYMEMINRGTH